MKHKPSCLLFMTNAVPTDFLFSTAVAEFEKIFCFMISTKKYAGTVAERIYQRPQKKTNQRFSRSSICRAKQLRLFDMQNQIRLGLEISAACSALARCEDLRRIVTSTTESNQVIDVIVVIKQQSQRQLNVFNKFLKRFRPIDATAKPSAA